METLSIEETKQVLLSFCNQPVYIHLEVNPEAHLRNAKITFSQCDFFGDDSFRVHFLLTDPEGILSIRDITDCYRDEGAIVLCGYDDQSRIAQTLSLSLEPLSM